MPNNTNITKKLKIAFKRWFKQSKAAGWDGFSEPFMASALFIINISQKHQQFQNLSFDELIRTVFYDDKNYFIEQQNKQLEKAKTFAEVQKLSEKETQELITKTKEKLALEMQKHQEQINTTLKYFDYKINDSGDISEDFEESKAIINKLDKLGYSAIFIKELKIVYEKGKNIGELSSKYLNNGYEIVTSGTFFYNGVPLGTILLKNKESYTTNEPKTLKRGGIAVLNSGIINYNTTNGFQINNITPIFEDKPVINDITFKEISETDEVSEFIGGGALIIKDNKKITGQELLNIQLFNQFIEENSNNNSKKLDGFDAEQMRQTYHLILGKYNELDFIILPKLKKPKLVSKIQKELYELGFSDVIKFDGGNGLFVDGNILDKHEKGAVNKSGFAIKVVKL